MVTAAARAAAQQGLESLRERESVELGVGEGARVVVVRGGGYALCRGTASVQSVDGVVDRRGKRALCVHHVTFLHARDFLLYARGLL